MPQDIDEDETREEESEEDLVGVVDEVVEPIRAGIRDEDEDLVVDVEVEGVEDFVITNAREELVEVLINNRAVEVLAVDVEDEEDDKRVEDLVVNIVGEELAEMVLDEEEVGRVETLLVDVEVEEGGGKVEDLAVDVEDEVVEGLVVEVARGDVVEVIINAGREADEVVEPK
ncbi:hypothetical protein BHYA_0037g00650 [Botrytis hyacinthi]|uniref:Uncharacterized protein n=1 Tax=Botrytis hyacinthi TaxID=278943 RepID=A0A4Z1GUA6_9HELO|nr:hypothetical protein BHYA_0037g00650 [Botrytis hyacinthi]